MEEKRTHKYLIIITNKSSEAKPKDFFPKSPEDYFREECSNWQKALKLSLKKLKKTGRWTHITIDIKRLL